MSFVRWLVSLGLVVLAQPVLAADLPADPTPVLGVGALRLDVQVQARVEEGRLLVQQDLRWTVQAGRGQVQLDGIPVPLFFVAIGQPPVVVDRAVLPATSQNIELETPGSVHIDRGADSLILRGTVDASAEQTAQVRYVVPLTGPVMTLGLSGHAAGQTWLSVALLAGPPVRVGLDIDWPARRSRFEEGRERLVGMSLTQPLQRQQSVRVTLTDLPVPARLPGRTLAWLGGGLALTGLAWLLRVRQRARAEAIP